MSIELTAVSTTLDRTEGRGRYRALVWRRQFVLAGLGAALLSSLCVDLAVGPARYGLSEVVQALVFPDTVSQQVRVVLWEIRMPVALMAIVVGAALAVAGAQMQTILNNPLASPFTLGISAAASFGAALALAFGVRLIPAAVEYVVPINAFVMAMLAAFLIHVLSVKRGVSAETIVLLGIALVFTFNALLALVQFFASAEALAAVVFWTMGSLTKATWPKLAVTTFILLAVLPIFARRAWALTALRLGEDKAASFGVKVGRLRLETLILVSLPRRYPRRLRRHHRVYRSCGAAHRSHGHWRGPAFLPAGLGPVGCTYPVGEFGRQQIAHLRHGLPDWHCHLAHWHPVLHLAHPIDHEALMVTLRLEALGARYGTSLRLREVTTPAFEGGDIVAVIGPNAAGKSTLFRRIAGLMHGPGAIHVEGATRAKSRICYMPQDTPANAVLSVYELSVACP